METEKVKYPTVDIILPEEKPLTSVISDLSSSMVKIHGQQETITNMLLNIDGCLIRYVENPTEEQMIMAVKQNGMAIQYILPMKQTEEIKLEAIKSNPMSVEFVYEPTHEMIADAVSTEFIYDGDYDEELPNHPIKLVKKLVERKTMEDQIFSFMMYVSFLKADSSQILYIKDDIRGLVGEEALWRDAIINHPSSGLPKECPIDVQAKIIDLVMNKWPGMLDEFDKSLWDVGRCLRYIKAKPFHINLITLAKPEYSKLEWYKHAINEMSELYEVRCLCYELSYEEKHSFNFMAELLETSRAGDVMDCCHNSLIEIEGMVEYIFDKFDFDTLFDDTYHTSLSTFIDALPFWKRIKYKRKFRKVVKSKAGA